MTYCTSEFMLLLQLKVIVATYLEVDEAVLVHVEGAEDVVAELLCVAAREEHLVHVDELGGRQLTVGAVLLWTHQANTSVVLQLQLHRANVQIRFNLHSL